jgi:hypothetical protein
MNLRALLVLFLVCALVLSLVEGGRKKRDTKGKKGGGKKGKKGK